ncbi:MAG: ATP phosphoribosyltransferase regulatory subunit [Selenomonadaceae bacterium]|nr:ATP phosphoribosyltransferase regulatory subunit [Selenomonadaceae bacterium]
MENIVLKIPYGMRDFLPDEAKEKRLIENKIAELFSKWGYKEVVTPTMEYLDTLMFGENRKDESRLIKFVAKDNRTIALRHEMTTPIARLAAMRFKDSPLPLKLSYISGVYRNAEIQKGRQCEFYQAGVELIGSQSAAADAEIIALAVYGILAAGIKNFKVSIGRVDFVKGIMEQYRIPSDVAENLQQVMERRNLVEYEKIIDSLEISAEGKAALKEIPYLKGNGEILNRARNMALNEQSRYAIERLTEVYSILEAYEVSEYISFDLGILRDMNYYTGIVFEAYTAGLGFPLCGGGRYDRLLSDFGRPLPAIGFAIGIERILLAKEREGNSDKDNSTGIYIAYAEGKLKEAIAKAKELRLAGKIICLALQAENEEQAKLCGGENGFDEVVYLK